MSYIIVLYIYTSYYISWDKKVTLMGVTLVDVAMICGFVDIQGAAQHLSLLVYKPHEYYRDILHRTLALSQFIVNQVSYLGSPNCRNLMGISWNIKVT